MAESTQGTGLSEAEIQASILEYLHFKQLFAWRNNNGAVFDPSFMGFRRKGRWDLNGAPDILVILPPNGRLLGVEVKKKDEKQSKDQIEFERLLKESGAAYILADDPLVFKKQLASYL